ncbi:hypothetical protein MiYa_02050 [Microcystis aeruginosa NIES-2519]|uniref:Uncharacterized protein n=1 Tax=Microcystis aeruginosa NIES-2519 TaxID=2303981 RepID=A0A5A5RBH9_MICAE|nr:MULTISPECIES: hypothetical protein [Microcystis]GCA70517.1 hypothetical protein MiYa_02050 [Microcystis aeruginosa NIES-2519]GCA86035.1 hypothetical protein MiHa_04020 [Microcystis aeruginosa NIES-2522]GCA91267.1 hypothetical protein MiTa_04635 [Microcystis aeruginosa NIES-4264]CCI33638.1 hypothetical protein MICAI_4060001 [Microcystis sp. T1-4]
MTLKYEDLAEDEQYFIDKIRGLSQSKRDALKNSENGFLTWIKTEIPKIWKKISGAVKDLWNWFKSLF